MAIKIDTKEKILSLNTLKQKERINRTHTLYINDSKGNNICIIYIDYVLIKYTISDNNNYNYMIDYNSLYSDKIIITEEPFEVSYTVSYGDYTDKNILVNANVNIYKQPHIGWNYRLYDNIIWSIMDNGEAKLWT